MSVIAKVGNTGTRIVHPGTYQGSNRIPAIITLYFVILLIAAARNRRLPDQQHAVALGVGALVVVATAAIAPRIVFWFMLAALVAIAATNADTIVNYIEAGRAKFNSAVATA